MSDNVSVTHVETETTGHGLEVTVTIRRDSRIFVGATPNPGDIPEDIRQALRRWLGSLDGPLTTRIAVTEDDDVEALRKGRHTGEQVTGL